MPRDVYAAAAPAPLAVRHSQSPLITTCDLDITQVRADNKLWEKVACETGKKCRNRLL